MNTQAKEAAEYINGYVEENLIKLADVIKDNPTYIKTETAANLLGVCIESMRTYLKNWTILNKVDRKIKKAIQIGQVTKGY